MKRHRVSRRSVTTLTALCALVGLLAVPAFVQGVSSLSSEQQLVGGVDLAGADVDGDLVAYRYYTSRSPETQELKVRSLSTGSETLIGSTSWTSGDAVLSGGRITYTDNLGQVQVRDIEGDRAPVSASASAGARQSSPDMDGDLLVWQDDRNGNWDVYYKDLESGVETQLTSDPSAQSSPKVSGTCVIWYEGSDKGLYLLDLESGESVMRISSEGAVGSYDISGDTVVWTEGAAVYAYSISSGETRTLASGAGERSGVAVDGDLVVWTERVTDYGDLVVHDLASGQTQTWRRPDTEWGPKISGSTVVYGRFVPGSVYTANNLMVAEVVSFQASSSIALTANASSVILGAPATLTARLTDGAGTASPGSTVELWAAAAGSASKKIASAATNSSGEAVFVQRPTATSIYQVKSLPSDADAGSVSAKVKVSVKAVLSKPVVVARIKRNTRVPVSGTLKPAHRGRVNLVIYKWSGSKYKTVAITASSTGRYSYRVALPAGKYKIRATHSDAGHALSASRYAYVTAR